MNAVYQWATVVCLAAIVGAMIELITPIGRMEKMVRFVLGAFMICAMIAPFTSTAIKITFDLPTENSIRQEDTSSFQQGLDQQILTVAADNIRALAVEELGKEQIVPQKIEVNMDTSDKESISIINVVVYLEEDQKETQRKARQVLEDGLGLPVEIIIVGR